jgi:glutamate/tyrosine decarboxylase-like PLP-dependent enzyme
MAPSGPVIVVSNAGEVNTGAFDDLDGLAERCAAHPGGAWLHVDAAFGLFAAASPRFAHLVRGIERADSIGADAHKWLNVPYDGGFAFVRHADALRAAFDATGSYLTPPPGAGWNPSTHVPEMSRRFRALSFWCALRADGRDGYRAMVERCVDNARLFGAWIARTPGLDLLAPVHLNVVCFRIRPEGADPEVLDTINREANIALQSGGQAFVSPTIWNGMAAIRSAFDNWATQPHDVELLCAAVSDQLARYSH